MLVADVQFVGDGAADDQVVANLAGVAEEVLVIELAAIPDRAAPGRATPF